MPPILLGAADQSAPTAMELAVYHESAVELIHELDCTIELSMGSTPSDTKPFTRWRYSTDRTVMRVRIEDYGMPLAGGRPQNLQDIFRDEREQKELLNWNEENPQDIGPTVRFDQGTVRATIQPVTRRLYRDPRVPLLHGFQLAVGDDTRTIAELLSESPEPAVVRQVTEQGQLLWHIHLKHAGYAENPLGGFIDIYLDPSIGYHARRCVSTINLDDLKGKKRGVCITREAGDFKAYPNGVYFPMTTTQANTYLLEDGSRQTSLWIHGVASAVVLNAPLPSDALTFRFPQWALVRHLPPHEGKIKVDIWGADDQPLKPFTSPESLMEFLPSVDRPLTPSAGKGRRVIWIVIIVNVILAGSLTAYFFRRSG